METGLPTVQSRFTQLLFDKYKPEDLYGKAIKDKRGGIDNTGRRSLLSILRVRRLAREDLITLRGKSKASCMS